MLEQAEAHGLRAEPYMHACMVHMHSRAKGGYLDLWIDVQLCDEHDVQVRSAVLRHGSMHAHSVLLDRQWHAACI